MIQVVKCPVSTPNLIRKIQLARSKKCNVRIWEMQCTEKEKYTWAQCRSKVMMVMVMMMTLMSPLSDFSSQWAAAGGAGMQRTAQQCNTLNHNAFALRCTVYCLLYTALYFNALHRQLDCDWPPHYIPITGWITSRQPPLPAKVFFHMVTILKLKFNFKLIKTKVGSSLTKSFLIATMKMLFCWENGDKVTIESQVGNQCT